MRNIAAARLRLRLLASAIALTTGTAAAAQTAGAPTSVLPTDGVVVAGKASVGQQGGSLTITQTSNRAVIDWKSFSVSAGNTVNVLQPGSGSALLNRVTGNDVSDLSGALNSNGQLFLVNRNGILIGPDGKVDARGGFIASTLDIANDDFMAGRLDFRGSGSGSVVNRGVITGGAVALLGSRVANLGTIASPMGRVAIGAAQQATLDLNGDGLLQVAIPSATDAADWAPLIDQSGLIDVGGGTVVMRAATAREIVRQTINMSGIVRATSVSQQGGVVVLDGGQTGAVAVSGTIDAGGVTGGRIDVTGGEVALTGATIGATGSERGGAIRIGGAYQGGSALAEATAALSARFGSLPALGAARITSVDAASRIDASGVAAGGSVVLWSTERTRQLGSVSAAGAAGGAIELSSLGALTTDLKRVTTGRGGALLLDPKNIMVWDRFLFGSTPSDPLSAGTDYGDNPGEDSLFEVVDIRDLLNGGTDVVLRASNDINWSAGLTVDFGEDRGDLALSAGRSVNIGGHINIGDSNLTVVANDSLANGVVDGDRDPGPGEINSFNAVLSGSIGSGASGGNIDLKIGDGAGVTNGLAGGMRLSSIQARSITVDAGQGTVALFDLGGGPNQASLSAADALTLTGAIKVQSGGGLLLSGRIVDWRNEASAAITATSPQTMVRFVENGVPTRFGVLRGGSDFGGEGGEGGAAATDTTRLALGRGTVGVDYSAVYGEAYGAFDGLHVVAGTLQAGDTLAGLLGADVITIAGPAAGRGVGDYAVTTTAAAGFGLNAGVSGYFIDLRQASDTLRVTPKTLTATVSAASYVYGAPTAVATMSGLVGSDNVGLSASVLGLGTQVLTGSAGSYAFAATMAAGQRDFTLTGLLGDAAANYVLDLSAASASLAIARKSVTVAGSNDSSIYGTLNGASLALSGALAGDDVAVGLGGISRDGIVSTLTATTNVGTYVTIASDLTGAAAGNYVIDLAGSSAGSVIITPKTLTYATANVTSTYGTLAVLGSPTLNGVIAGDAVGAAATLSNGAVGLSERMAAGTYGITATLEGAGAGNYLLSSTGNLVGALTVGRKLLIASVADATQVYLAPVSLATLNGVLAGDDISAVGTLDNSFVGMVPAGTNGVGFQFAEVGSHAFRLSGITGLQSGNYQLAAPNLLTATLTVTPKPINYTIGSATRTYGSFGNPFSVSLTGALDFAASVLVTDSRTGVTTAYDPNARYDAGSYVLTATGLSGVGAHNYMLAASGNQLGALTIDPKTITFAANSGTSVYGNTPFTPFAGLIGAFQTDDVAATVVIRSGGNTIPLTERTNAGTYGVTVTGLSGSAAGNYVLAGGTDGQYVITPSLLRYTLTSASAFYGQTPTPRVEFTGLLFDDVVAPNYLIDGNASDLTRLDAGNYSLSLGTLGGPAGGNYTASPLASASTMLNILRAPLTYSLAASSSIFGNPLNIAPLLWSGMQYGEAGPVSFAALNGATTNSFLNAGTYRPDVIANIGSNYFLDTANSVAGLYTVERRSLALVSTPIVGALGTTYGLVASDIKASVRALSDPFIDAVALGVTPQNLSLSTGGYVNAGTYELKIGAAVGDGYGINHVIGSITNSAFTVTPFVVTPNGRGGATSTYGTLASLNAAAPNFRSGDQIGFTGLAAYRDGQVVTLASQTAAGEYSVRASGLTGADSANYRFDATTEVGRLLIERKALSFVTGSYETTYGTLGSIGTAALTGVVGSDEVIGLNQIVNGYSERSAAGLYGLLNPLLTGAAAANYVTTHVGSSFGTLGIAQRALTATFLDVGNLTYGARQSADGAYYRLNGVLAGDEVLAGATYVSLTGVAAGNDHLRIGELFAVNALLNAGTYQTSAWGPRGATLAGTSAGNYYLPNGAATNSATFQATPRTISGTLTAPATAVYGDAPAISASFANLVGSGAVDYTVAATLGSTVRQLGRATALPANLAVGTQQLGLSLAGLDRFNYALGAPVTTQILLTPKALSVVSVASSTTYGFANDALFGFEGLVAGDEVAPMVSIKGAAATRGIAIGNAFGVDLYRRDVGNYLAAIDTLTGAAAGNYTLASFVGDVRITPKSITYTSDGFAAQYGGLTLPTCSIGCEMSGKDNMLAYGKVTLNGAMAEDLGLLQPRTLLSLDGRTGSFEYARNTDAGTYLQIVAGLGGSKAGNYVLDTENSKAGLVSITPALIRATVSGGGRLITNVATGQYAALGTPGIVTVNRSDNIGAAGGSFYPGDRVNVGTGLVDANGNLVDGSGPLAPGTYTINPLVLTGADARNYVLLPLSQGSRAGKFTVATPAIFNFTFQTANPTGYYVPAAISNPPIAPVTTTTTRSSTTTSATAGITGGAGAGAEGSISSTQTYADGSSVGVSAGGSTNVEASYTPLSATATAFVGGNVSLILTRGPVTINYAAFTESSAKVEISLKDLTITAGGEAMAGVQEGVTVAGYLGSGVSGSTGFTGQAFASANGEGTLDLKNGATIGTSAFVGVGASAGLEGSLSGGGVTASLSATVYSPGSLYIGAKFESGYADQTLTIGFNLGLSLLIGGLEISPTISFSTAEIEGVATDFASGWAGAWDDVTCTSACEAARLAASNAATYANSSAGKLEAAYGLMTDSDTYSLPMIQYLEANPQILKYATDPGSDPALGDAARAVNSAVFEYKALTDRLTSVVSQQKALLARISADPSKITAADLELANALQEQERQIVAIAQNKFNTSVIVVDGTLTFGKAG